MKDIIDRVVCMEAVFDEIQRAFKLSHLSIYDKNISKKIETLKSYYTSEEWLKDYEADENGMIPDHIKRGVLSQDGVYDLLKKIDSIKKRVGR